MYYLIENGNEPRQLSVAQYEMLNSFNKTEAPFLAESILEIIRIVTLQETYDLGKRDKTA